jgi:hypothetical protein
MAEAFQNLAASPPCARHDSGLSHAGGAWFVVQMAAARTTPQMKDGPDVFDFDALSLTVGAEGRKGILPAMGAAVMFHCFLP